MRASLFHLQLLSLAVISVFVGSGTAQAENWPQWRGPSGNGISNETGIAERWSKTENVVWRAALPGREVPLPPYGRIAFL